MYNEKIMEAMYYKKIEEEQIFMLIMMEVELELIRVRNIKSGI